MNDIKNLDYYRNLSYGITLRKDGEGDWVARVEELPGCTAHGGTQPEALRNLEEVKTAWIEDAIEAGDAIPEPKVDERLPSGKWLQRVPRSLHKSLTKMAEMEGVSLNQFVTAVLAEAVGRCKAARATVVSPIDLRGWNTMLTEWDLGTRRVDMNAWQIDPHRPAEFVIEMLDSPMLSAQSQINEGYACTIKNHFRVMERASKKELA
jgi:antitoxin HicB